MNNKIIIIYDYIKNRDKVYVLYAENDKEYIKTHFPSVKFIGKFKLIFYTLFFKDNIMFYASDDKLIDKLRFFKKFHNYFKQISIALSTLSI